MLLLEELPVQQQTVEGAEGRGLWSRECVPVVNGACVPAPGMPLLCPWKLQGAENVPRVCEGLSTE